jgi:putative spermidine/putrescine transport system permease protein
MSSSSGPDQPSIDVAGLAAAEEILEQKPPIVEKALGEERAAKKGSGWMTALWALPGGLWLGFYLIAPLVFIVLVSFWTYKVGAKSGFITQWTTANYGTVFHDSTYWRNMIKSFETSLIAVAACFLFGFPIAYFLALKVQNLRYQLALFIIALAPFWTSFLVRSVAWTYPLMSREGAVNQVLQKVGIINQPIAQLGASQLSVTLAMIQLYILFMITPLFFTLAQVDRTALEAARDLGGNWWRTFTAVILPQIMPGIVIGSIFIFVLTMGEYGTVLVVGENAVQSVGTIVNSYVTNAVEYPQGSAAAVLLVIALILGVFAITRFSKLREEL